MKYILFALLALSVSFTGVSQVTSKVYVRNVFNNIQKGPQTGNFNLAFGIKNILSETLQDKGYDIVPEENAELFLDVELVYFDVEQTKSNLSVYHKEDNAVVIRLKGTVYDKKEKKINQVLVTDKSSEIVNTVALVTEEGGFNTTLARNAVKKTCVLLTYRLFNIKE